MPPQDITKDPVARCFVQGVKARGYSLQDVERLWNLLDSTTKGTTEVEASQSKR
jgi:hypothetical protein